PDHCLERPNPGRSDRKIFCTNADQRHGFQGPAGHFTANPSRDARVARLVEDSLEEPQNGRAEPVVSLSKTWVGAIGSEQKLCEVVGPDRDEIDLRKQLVEHFGKARHLKHRAELDALGKLAMAAPRPFHLLLE